MMGLAAAALLVGTVAPAGAAGKASPATAFSESEFNDPGNILIADQFNNRVIEVDQAGHIVWHFGEGPRDLTAHSIIGTNDAQRVGPFTLMAGTGDPPGVKQSMCTDPNGCPDNRVILVDPFGHIVWQYGQFAVTGSGPNQLNTPVQSTWLPNFHVLITDQANQRIIEVSLDHKIVWQYGTTGVTGAGPNQLNNPNSAELLANGNILIADENNNRAIEVNRKNQIIHTYTAGGTASGVAFASRLSNGHTLLTDSNNNRAVEVDAKDTVVWEYATNLVKGSNPSPLPTRAIRLRDGDTLISDQFNNRVIEVTAAKTIERQLGVLNIFGFDTKTVNKGLNGPYDAKSIGDYTGLTPPFGFGS
jgi:hypothetical protein